MLDLTYAVVGKVELCFEKDNPMEITMGKNLPIFHAYEYIHLLVDDNM